MIGVQHQQKAIYYIQRELELLLSDENRDRLLICDRGSLDGMAYWPGPGPSTDFLDYVQSKLEAEVARYDWVIHLDTAPLSFYDVTNPLRNESFEEAWKLNERIKEAWSAHPQRFVIENVKDDPSHGHFLEKMSRALLVVEQIVDGRSYAEIQSSLISDP